MEWKAECSALRVPGKNSGEYFTVCEHPTREWVSVQIQRGSTVSEVLLDEKAWNTIRQSWSITVNPREALTQALDSAARLIAEGLHDRDLTNDAVRNLFAAEVGKAVERVIQRREDKDKIVMEVL